MRLEFLQNIIDVLRHKFFRYTLLVEKNEELEECQEIKTLILGSSHLRRGYIALKDKQECNVATSSQDLYYSYNLYKYCNNLKPGIKNIIISFSVFTPGHSLIRTAIAPMCILFKELFGISYQYPDIAKKKKLYWLEPLYRYELNLYKNKRDTDVKSKDISDPPKNFNLDKIKTRALKHYKNNQRPISQIPYLVKIIEEAKEKGQKVYIIIPPATAFYRDVLPSGKELFACLYESIAKFDNVKIINVYDSKEFDNSDFMDGDHLNNEGAKKLTNLIRVELYSK